MLDYAGFRPLPEFSVLSEVLHDPVNQPYFGPTYPHFFCCEPSGEPPCTPSRTGIHDGTVTRGAAADSDWDGDGITDNVDNCRKVFNPVRPMDDGVQADVDGDGRGNASDECPLDAGPVCIADDPYTGEDMLLTDGF